jgi:hypothetical protein
MYFRRCLVFEETLHELKSTYFNLESDDVQERQVSKPSRASLWVCYVYASRERVNVEVTLLRFLEVTFDAT